MEREREGDREAARRYVHRGGTKGVERGTQAKPTSKDRREKGRREREREAARRCVHRLFLSRCCRYPWRVGCNWVQFAAALPLCYLAKTQLQRRHPRCFSPLCSSLCIDPSENILVFSVLCALSCASTPVTSSPSPLAQLSSPPCA